MEPWDVTQVEIDLKQAYKENSETKVLEVLKHNTFLFYELFSRKHGIQPIFHEVSFGDELRCDFAWLNDNSYGPEWVLVEIERPKISLFTKCNIATSDLNKGIEQIRSWQMYFNSNHGEKKRIFGAVERFRYVLVVGASASWQVQLASAWRSLINNEQSIEVRSFGVFDRALEMYKQRPDDFWSFKEHPITEGRSKLTEYLKNNEYLYTWRAMRNT